MNTIVTEVEAVLNSRPLTYIQTDSTNVLTPFHLYTGSRALDPPDPRIVSFNEMAAEGARKRVLKLDKIIGSFWNTWSKDYLTSLRENSINLGRKGEGPKVGDVVVIHHDDKKRTLWKLGRVIDLLRGKDGIVRGARVKTDSKYLGGIIERPLQKLFPLEMGRGDDDKSADTEAVGETADGKAADGKTADGKTADGKTADGKSADADAVGKSADTEAVASDDPLWSTDQSNPSKSTSEVTCPRYPLRSKKL